MKLYHIKSQERGDASVIARSMSAAIKIWREYHRDLLREFYSGPKPENWEDEWPVPDIDQVVDINSVLDPDSVRVSNTELIVRN